MIQGVGAASQQLYTSQQSPARQQQVPSGSGALPEAPSPFDIAMQIQEVQTDNVKRALDAQTLILDLLA